MVYKNWVPVHRLVWIEHHGPIPAGHAVAFKPGQHTSVLEEITLDRLELVSRAELMRRNTYHKYPKEIAQLIQLRGALQRQINKRERQLNEKQDPGSAQSPVRNARKSPRPGQAHGAGSGSRDR
jgi:hypothetical protein